MRLQPIPSRPANLRWPCFAVRGWTEMAPKSQLPRNSRWPNLMSAEKTFCLTSQLVVRASFLPSSNTTGPRVAQDLCTGDPQQINAPVGCPAPGMGPDEQRRLVTFDYSPYPGAKETRCEEWPLKNIWSSLQNHCNFNPSLLEIRVWSSEAFSMECHFQSMAYTQTRTHVRRHRKTVLS